MSSPGSETHWIRKLRSGDPAAIQQLWESYFQRLVALARTRLRGAARRVADEEDVALGALHSFCRGAGLGRFPQLLDRDDLWRLLVIITARKANYLINQQRRQKRGGGKVHDEAWMAATPDLGAALEQIISAEPTPEFVVQVAEEYQRLLQALGSEELRSIAVWKMEGSTIEEIAARLECAPRTVHRKLDRIRGIWTQEAKP